MPQENIAVGNNIVVCYHDTDCCRHEDDVATKKVREGFSRRKDLPRADHPSQSESQKLSSGYVDVSRQEHRTVGSKRYHVGRYIRSEDQQCPKCSTKEDGKANAGSRVPVGLVRACLGEILF